MTGISRPRVVGAKGGVPLLRLPPVPTTTTRAKIITVTVVEYDHKEPRREFSPVRPLPSANKVSVGESQPSPESRYALDWY